MKITLELDTSNKAETLAIYSLLGSFIKTPSIDVVVPKKFIEPEDTVAPLQQDVEIQQDFGFSEPVERDIERHYNGVTRDDIRDEMPEYIRQLHGYFFNSLQRGTYGLENVLIESFEKGPKGCKVYTDENYRDKIINALKRVNKRNSFAQSGRL